MADFNRTVTYTGAADMIDKLTTFLTTSGPGPDWELEVVFSTAGNSFLRTINGTDVVYVHLFTDGADTNVAFIRYVEDDNTSNGWDAGTGPAAGFFADDLRSLGTGLFATADGGSMDMIASEDRCIVTASTNISSTQTTAYFGMYDAHTDPGNDTYSNIVLANTSGIASLNDIAAGLIVAPAGSFSRRTLTGFPSSFIKSRSLAGDSARVYQMWDSVDSKSEMIPHRGQVIPMDDRASPQEIFAYENWLTLTENGHGESLFLTGLYRASNKLTPGDQITIGASDYLVIPLSPDSPSFGSLMIAGPIGTAI